MLEPQKEYAISPYSYGEIGGFTPDVKPAIARKHTIVQSLWTKPIKDDRRFRSTLCLAALSLAYAHRSGYKVNMHTDSLGMELLKGYGYENLLPTLNTIPYTVPTQLFAAGKFFALRAEGNVGKVHIDIDVFLKKPGILELFYEDKSIDAICQMDEDYEQLNGLPAKIREMKALGYPSSTFPEWMGSMNTGVVGFNNPALAAEYIDNYFASLNMYTQKRFDWFKRHNAGASLQFDFILEQVNLSYMSRGYNVMRLVPTNNPSDVANEIGYQHLQGGGKWDAERQAKLRALLAQVDKKVYFAYREAAERLEIVEQ